MPQVNQFRVIGSVLSDPRGFVDVEVTGVGGSDEIYLSDLDTDESFQITLRDLNSARSDNRAVPLNEVGGTEIWNVLDPVNARIDKGTLSNEDTDLTEAAELLFRAAVKHERVRSGNLFWSHNNVSGRSSRWELDFTYPSGDNALGSDIATIRAEITSGQYDMFSGLTADDIGLIGVDTGEQYGTFDVDLSGVVKQVKGDGNGKLTVEFESSSGYSQTEGDTVMMILNNVNNPSDTQDHDVEVEMDSSGNTQTGTVTLE